MINELLPPIAKKIYRKIYNPIKIYKSFEHAQAAASRYPGYDSTQLHEVIFKKTSQFIEMLHQNPGQHIHSHHLFLLSVIAQLPQSKKIRVLDFGGAFATHYFLVKTYFPHLAFDWKVVELPQMVKKAQALARPELSFVESDIDFNVLLGEFDLVLSSGTLQHMPDPAKTLQFLLAHKAPYMGILRVAMNASKNDLWLLHRVKMKDCGPGILHEEQYDQVVYFPFCILASTILSTVEPSYLLAMSNSDDSGTVQVPGYKIYGGNYLYKRSSQD